jgi:hypothetical protein
MVDKNGNTSREGTGRHGLVCLNNSGYRDYLKAIIHELLTTYDFESLFLDMPLWPMVCYCSQCRERFYQECAQDLPKVEDWDNPLWVQFAYSRQNWLYGFIRSNNDYIKSIRPEMTIEQNSSGVNANWILADTERIVEACDYASGDFFGGYLEQTFMCKYYNSVTPEKPFAYMTSRCDPNLGAHTVSRCTEDLLIRAITTLVHNGAFSMVDAMNPDGSINERVYLDSLKAVFASTGKYEQYVNGELLADVAIWYNTNMKSNQNYIQSPLNISEIMREHNISYNVIGSSNLSDLNAQVICINDVNDITDHEMAIISRFIMDGGNLFITGRLGNRGLEEMLGVKVTGKSEYTENYLVPQPGGTALFHSFDKKNPYQIRADAWICELHGDADVLATLAFPYTKPGDKNFMSIHTNPPGIFTNIPAIIEKSVGPGKVIWVCTPLELNRAHYCRMTVCSLIERLIKKRHFISNAPDFVEIIAWKKDDMKYIAVLNQQPKYPVYPISNIEITLPDVEKQINLLTPSREPVNIKYTENSTIIGLPSLDIFHIIQIDKTPVAN